jgi:hypothetical protein
MVELSGARDERLVFQKHKVPRGSRAGGTTKSQRDC